MSFVQDNTVEVHIVERFNGFHDGTKLTVIHDDDVKLILLDLFGRLRVAWAFHDMNLEGAGLDNVFDVLLPSRHGTLGRHNQSATGVAVRGTIGTHGRQHFNGLPVIARGQMVRQ